jgi:hypothetical protein
VLAAVPEAAAYLAQMKGVVVGKKGSGSTVRGPAQGAVARYHYPQSDPQVISIKSYLQVSAADAQTVAVPASGGVLTSGGIA